MPTAWRSSSGTRGKAFPLKTSGPSAPSGLQLVRRMADQITSESSVSHGTTFFAEKALHDKMSADAGEAKTLDANMEDARGTPDAD